jgi:hypothetical protein
MTQGPPAVHVLTGVNAVALTIAGDLRSAAPSPARMYPDIAMVFLYLSGSARARTALADE